MMPLPMNSNIIEREGLVKAIGPQSICEKLEAISMLPEASRARIAAFCYQKVHLREIGLRVAATCSVVALRKPFGGRAQAILDQASRVDTIVAELESDGKKAPTGLLI
jgi:hypothetical protein